MDMHTNIIDGTVLVFLGVLLVSLQRVGLAAIAGGIGFFLIWRCM
jgi:hypothetical protein